LKKKETILLLHLVLCIFTTVVGCCSASYSSSIEITPLLSSKTIAEKKPVAEIKPEDFCYPPIKVEQFPKTIRERLEKCDIQQVRVMDKDSIVRCCSQHLPVGWEEAISTPEKTLGWINDQAIHLDVDTDHRFIYKPSFFRSYDKMFTYLLKFPFRSTCQITDIPGIPEGRSSILTDIISTDIQISAPILTSFASLLMLRKNINPTLKFYIVTGKQLPFFVWYFKTPLEEILALNIPNNNIDEPYPINVHSMSGYLLTLTPQECMRHELVHFIQAMTDNKFFKGISERVPLPTSFVENLKAILLLAKNVLFLPVCYSVSNHPLIKYLFLDDKEMTKEAESLYNKGVLDNPSRMDRIMSFGRMLLGKESTPALYGMKGLTNPLELDAIHGIKIIGKTLYLNKLSEADTKIPLIPAGKKIIWDYRVRGTHCEYEERMRNFHDLTTSDAQTEKRDFYLNLHEFYYDEDEKMARVQDITD
jgi:hypothetical protein